MTAKDAAFLVLFVLFVLSVIGNGMLLLSYIGSGETEADLRQHASNLEIQKNTLQQEYEKERDKAEEIEEENEDLQREVEALERTIEELKRTLESQSGTSATCEMLVDSLRVQVEELRGEKAALQRDLQECEARTHYCYSWHDPCSYYGCCSSCSCPCSSCSCPCSSCSCPCSSCSCSSPSISVYNGSGTVNGHPYDAVIYVYFDYYPCAVLRIYVDILGTTIQVVGVDWD